MSSGTVKEIVNGILKEWCHNSKLIVATVTYADIKEIKTTNLKGLAKQEHQCQALILPTVLI
jgi:hypothetical protein